MDSNERETPRGEQPDEAFERLAAADPAASAPEPVAGVLRARVAALTGDAPLGDVPAGDATADGATSDRATGDPGTPSGRPGIRPAGTRPDRTGPDGRVPDELAARRRRRTRWLAVAAVAGVVAAGGGGYVAGAGTGGPVVVASTAAPPITLGGPGGAGVAEDATDAGPAGVAPQAAADAAATGDGLARETTYPAGLYGRTVFHADPGLSGAAGVSPAYGLDAAGVSSAANVARVAEILGVSGEPREEYGWVVGPNDGSGPTVTITPDGEGSLQYWDPTVDPWYCPGPVGSGTDDGAGADSSTGSEGGTEPDIMPVPDCPDGNDVPAAPDTEGAVVAVREVLQRLGVDVSRFEIETSESYDGDPFRYVSAYHLLDGQRTGLAWSATVSEKGLSGLYGFLAPVVGLGDYPVISAAEAVERLGDPRFGATGGFYPIAETGRTGAVEDGAVQDGAVEEPMPTAPPAPTPGADIAWPVTDVTITTARLGLARHSGPDGAALLLPAYELGDGEGNTWSVVAVADGSLDFAP